MPTWLVIIIIAAIVCGIIGFLSSNDGERGEGALTGAIGGAMGCGYILFRLFLWGLGIALLIWLFGAIFG